MIRLAAEKDIAQIAQLESECIECAWNTSMLMNAYNDESYTFIVEENDGEIVSYIFYKIVAYDEAEICNLATKKAFRRQGRADSIVREAIKKMHSQRIRNVFLEVNKTNLAAISLYERHSFFRVNVRKNYYKDGGDAVVMQRIIY